MPDDERKDPEFTKEQDDYTKLQSDYARCCTQIRELKLSGNTDPEIDEKIASLEQTKIRIEHGLNILQPMSTKKTTFV